MRRDVKVLSGDGEVVHELSLRLSELYVDVVYPPPTKLTIST